MDILAALSQTKPAPAFPLGAAADAADPESGQVFQAILGELAGTGENADGKAVQPAILAAGQSSPLLRKAAQAAGAITADGAIDLGMLSQKLRQDIGALLTARADGEQAADLPLDAASLVGPLLSSEGAADASSGEAEIALAITGDALPGDALLGAEAPAPLPMNVPTSAPMIAAVIAPVITGTPTAPTTDQATAAAANTAGAPSAAPAAINSPLAGDPDGDVADAQARGAAASAGTPSPAAMPAKGKDGATEAASRQDGRSADAAAAGGASTDVADTDSAAAAALPAETPGDKDEAGAAGVAALAIDRPGKKAAKAGTDTGRGPDANAMAAIAGNAAVADDQAISAATAKREARLALDTEAANQRRGGPKAVAETAEAAAGPQPGAKPTNTQPQVQATGLAERAIAGAQAGGGDAGQNGASDRQPDRGTTSELSTANAVAAESGKAGGTDFLQHLAAAKPLRGGANAAPPAPHQVAVHIQRASQDGLDRVSIQLRPIELGRIDVRMEFGGDGVMRARIVAENPQTLELLKGDSRSLEKALQDAGVRTEQGSLSFSLRDEGRSAQQQQDRPGKGRGTAFTIDGDTFADDKPVDRPTRLVASGRVDVRV